MPSTKRHSASSSNMSGDKVLDESSEPNNKRLFKKEEEVTAVTAANNETKKVDEEQETSDDDVDVDIEEERSTTGSNERNDQIPPANSNANIATPTTTTTITTTTNPSGLVILDRIHEFNITTWWLVDLHADPAPRQGATLLVRRCMKAYGWTETKTRSVLKAYRQFLFIKKQTKDWNAEILSPSSSVDQMWHQHILDVVNYSHDCMLLCGFVVGHNPDHGMYDDDEEGRKHRRNATREALLEHFPNVDRSGSGEWKEIFLPSDVLGNVPDEAAQEASASGGGLNGNDMLTIQVHNLSGHHLLVRVNSNARMERVYKCVALNLGVQKADIRLLQRDGYPIRAHATPQTLGLRDFDEIIFIRS